MPDYDEALEENAFTRVLMIQRIARDSGSSEEVAAAALLAAAVWELSCELDSK
jgi:hypothetical protein